MERLQQTSQQHICLEKAKPVLKTLPGWKCDIRGIKKYEDLPENCRKYIEFIEKEIGYPITMVSVTDQDVRTSFIVSHHSVNND